MKAFARQAGPEDKDNLNLARRLHESYLEKFDKKLAILVLEFLIRTSASVYQSRFCDSDGGQYPRLISPDAIVGDRVAFRRISTILSSKYVQSGGLEVDGKKLIEAGIFLSEDLLSLLQEFRVATQDFYACPTSATETIELLLERLRRIGDTLEDDDIAEATVPVLVGVMYDLEEQISDWLNALHTCKARLNSGQRLLETTIASLS